LEYKDDDTEKRWTEREKKEMNSPNTTTVVAASMTACSEHKNYDMEKRWTEKIAREIEQSQYDHGRCCFNDCLFGIEE